MRDRVVLAITVLFLAVVAGPLLAGWSAAPAAAQAPTTYTFEECEEGWEVTENFTGPTTMNTWERSDPGANNTETAWRSGPPYPMGLGANDEDIYEASVTSLPHKTTGAPVTVDYFITHDLETDFDYLFLEWSRDGETWTEAEKWTGLSEGYPEFIAKKTSIAAPAGELQLRFRLMSDQNTTGSGGDVPVVPTEGEVAFDEVKINLARPAAATCGGSTSPTQTSTATTTPTQTPTATSPPTNPPKKCTERGTSKGETLRGTREPDRICARGGNDKLYGLRANDMLLGGRGRDLLVGGLGRDTCRGGPGKDRFKGCETKRQ